MVPLVCGTSQAVNDWFDRHVDAINEPNRPIPSGRIAGTWGLRIAIIGTACGLVAAAFMGIWVFAATIVALLLFGYIKGRFTGMDAVQSALRTALIGGLAAGAAYGIAKAIS